MTRILSGKCHCGAVAFEITLDKQPDFAVRCDCSLCKRKGALMCPVPVESLTITRGAENLGLYRWGTMKAKHYFCKTCGIYTHHQRFINPNEYCFNVGCVDDIDPESLEIRQVQGSKI